MLGIHNRCKDMGSTHCTTQAVSLQTLATCFLHAMEWVWPFLGGCGMLFRLLLLVCWLWLPPLSQCHVHIGSQHNVHQDHCHHSTHHRAVLVPQNTCARDKHVTITSYAAVGLPRPLLRVPITKYKIIPHPNPNPNTKMTVNTIPKQM